MTHDEVAAFKETFKAEVFKAICFHCRDGNEPATTDSVSWLHAFKGGDGQTYNKTACKASELRAYYHRSER